MSTPGFILTTPAGEGHPQAALAAYAGILVDRVVLLSGGQYEVHCIGVNWPHHVFADPSFMVLGAN